MPDNGNRAPANHRMPWNKGKLIGARPPLRPKHVWSIRTRLDADDKSTVARSELLGDLSFEFDAMGRCLAMAFILRKPGSPGQFDSRKLSTDRGHSNHG
jgi:hypothetical protein